MASPFVAEIRMFGFNFAPKGWATCDGQILPISQNTALFSLLGTFYGGNGQSTFALPNLQGYGPIHVGQGAGLSQRFLGEQSGAESVTLLGTEMPLHDHSANCDGNAGGQTFPPGTVWGVGPNVARAYSAPGNPTNMSFGNNGAFALSLNGGSQPHNNMPPYLVVNFCIAMQGVFPARP